MNSPTYKNLRNSKNSPLALKEKMRKSYKSKVQSCRDMLMNKFRGSVTEEDIRHTLTSIFEHYVPSDEEELMTLEQIKNELVQEELEWCLKEYERSQQEMDWSLIEEDNGVICPICQKKNLTLQNNLLTCPSCTFNIMTQLSLLGVKRSILSSLEKHCSKCRSDFQFVLLSETEGSHIYLMCNTCSEFKMIV